MPRNYSAQDVTDAELAAELDRIEQYLMPSRVFYAIRDERVRQEKLVFANQVHGWVSAADPHTSDEYRMGILGEEFGEVFKAKNEIRTGEATIADLRKELIELAACAIAWIEGIDAGTSR